MKIVYEIIFKIMQIIKSKLIKYNKGGGDAQCDSIVTEGNYTCRQLVIISDVTWNLNDLL